MRRGSGHLCGHALLLLGAAILALAWRAPARAAEQCSEPQALARVSISEAPLSVHSDFSLAQVESMAAHFGGKLLHVFSLLSR
jgi:hypothetical protein